MVRESFLNCFTMDTRWRWRAIYFGILFLTTVTADSRRCSSGCFGARGSLYNFHEGTVYKYQFEGSTVTTLPGVQNDVTKLGISGVAEVSAQEQCAFVLKLSNVNVQGPDGKKYDSLSEECAKPVHFTLSNGVLDNNLCTEDDDTGAALNIKRAIISLFQTAELQEDGSATNYESDVFGTCPTEFKFSKEGNTLTVRKVRNLNRCAHREEFAFPFLSTEYTSNSYLQSTPLLDARYDVKQKIEGGVLKSSEGEEVYDYRPLLTPESGAKVTVSMKLDLAGSSQGSVPANGNRRRTVFFEVPHDKDGVSNANALLKALQDTVSEFEPSVGHTAAKNFLNLVDVLEHASKADILAVYSQVKNKDTAKHLLLDGLLYAGSADSVVAAAELLVNREIPEANALRWYLDLNFVKHVSAEALKAVMPLLDGDKVPYQAYLGVGALAGKFCRDHDCESVPEFKELLNKLSAPLFAGCKVSSVEKENNLIASLKGLSNVHEVTDEVAEKLSQCAADKNVKTRIRVAALDVFHSDAGKDKLKKTAMNLFKDTEEDSEVRIKAYLALVEKPCQTVADLIKDTLDKEPVNQVGSYVVSHLRNLRASTNPDKAKAKAFLGGIITKKKFPIDARKFSQNYELSYSVDALNLGASVEANRIFSQKSYIPRSVSLNLTTQLFGHSFNLLEVDARAENFDYVLEKYFGPKGFFQTKETNEVIQESDSYRKHLAEKVKHRYSQSVRPKRSVSKQDIDGFADKVKLGVDYEDNHLDLDLSLKLFGSEVGWFTYNDKKQDFSVDKLIDKMFDRFDNSVDKAKNVNMDFKKARTFLDATINYPTGLGFGLKVKTLGSSAVSIKVDGQFDLPALLSDPHSSEIHFQVLPSGSVELSTLLAVDADCVESGVRVSANVYTNTGSDLSVRVLEGFGIDVKLGLPVNKQELISFSSDIVHVVREQGQPQTESPLKFNVKRQEHGGCFDQWSSQIGLTFCGELSYPQEGFKAFSPAYGPSKASLRFEKDQDLTVYHFKAFVQTKDNLKLEILLDTPNSNQNRKIQLYAEESSNPRAYLLKLTTPWKEVSVDAVFVDSDREQSVTVKLKNDDALYSLKAGALLSGDSSRRKYEPLLEYKAPEGKSHDRFIGKKGGRGKTQQQTYGVGGAVFVDMKPGSPYRKYELKSVTLTTPRNKYTVDGTVTVDTGLIATDLVASCDKDTYTLNSKLQKLEDKNYKASVEFLPSAYPDFGFSVKWEYSGDKNKIENKLVVTHGPDPESEETRLSLSQMFKYNYESVQNFDFVTKNTVSYPLLGISAKLEVDAKPKSIDIELAGSYDKSTFEAGLEAKVGTNHKLDYDVELELKALGNSIDLSCKHEVLSEGRSKFTNSLELKPGGKYQLNAIVVYSLDKFDINNHIEAELRIPSDPKVVKLSAGVKNNKNEASGEFVVTAANKPLIEIKGEVEKSSKPSGNFKVFLPNYIDSSGNFKCDGHKFSGELNADFLKTGRKVQGKADGLITNSVYKGYAELQWDANRNPSKKLRIETDTDYSPNSIDSKNSLTFNDQKTQVNVKGQLDGKLTDGTVDGNLELEFPCGNVITFKVHRVCHIVPGNNQMEGNWELAHYERKGANPRKLTFKLASKNVDPVKLTFDGQGDLTYTTPANKDITIHVVAKKVPHGEDRWIFAGEAAVTGSLINRPVKVKLDTEASDEALKTLLDPNRPYAPLQYQLQVSAGDDISLNAVGKLSEHIANEEFELKLPSDLPVTHVKYTSNNVMDLFPEKGKSEYLKSNNLLQWNGDKFIRFNGEYNSSKDENELSGKLEVETHFMPLHTLTGRIFAEATNDENSGKVELDLALAWEGKTASFETKIDYDNHKKSGHMYVKSAVPDTGTFEGNFNFKRLENKRGVAADLSIKANENYLKSVYEVELNDDSFTTKIDVDSSKGKVNIYLRGARTGKAEFELEGKVDGDKGKCEFDAKANFQSPEDFFLKVNADSEKLKLNKFQLEVANKPAKTAGKRMGFFAKTADKTYFTGSLTYNVKRDDNSMIIEGSGVVKIGDSNYPLQVKTQIDGKDKETGILNKVSSDVQFGKYKYDYEHKVSTIGIEAKRTFCLESKCSSAEFIVLRDHIGPASFTQKISIVLDYSRFVHGIEDYIYKETTKVNGYFFDSEINMQYGDNKVHRHVYLKENEAGIVVELPSRTLAAELTYAVPKGKKEGALKVEGSLWLDKAKAPNEKTTLLITTDSAESRDGGSVSGEVRFSAPGLGKDLAIKGRGELQRESNKIIDASFEADIFAKKGQKLVADWKVLRTKDEKGVNIKDIFHAYSKGLGWDVGAEGELTLTKSSLSWISKVNYLDSKKAKKEGIAQFEISQSKFVYLVKIPESTLIDLDYKLTSNSIVGDINLVGNEYKEKLVLNGKKKYTFEFTRDQKKEVLDIEFGFAPGQIIELSGSYNQKSFVSYAVALDELNFLKTKYSYDIDVLKALTQTYQEEIVHVAQDGSNIAKAALERVSIDATDFSEDVRKALPNFKPVLDAYEKELKEIKEEIINNQQIKEATEYLRNLLAVPLQQLAAILEITAKALKSTLDVLNTAWQKINESVKILVPKLKESYENIVNAIIGVFTDTLKFAANLFSNILDKIKEHEEEIKEFITTITDFMQDIGKVFAKSFDQIQKEVLDFLRVLTEQLKALPQFEMLKEKLQELKQYKIPDQAWSVYEEITTGLEQSMPTEELKQFISKATDYIEKLLKGQPVDSIKELEDLYNSLKAAIRSVIVMISSAAQDEQYFKPSGPVPLPAFTFWEAPVGAVRFSLLSWLQSTDLPSWSDLYYTYRPTLNPLDYFPPYRASGLLVHNTEFFTFDNRHYTFKGTCGYLLAQDFVDGNFSVSVNLEGGKIKSLYISDRDNIVESRSDGTVYVNGAQAEYPLHQGDLYGWRNYHTVNFASAAGLLVHCHPSLDACSFHISGFYFGKIRGLLGTLDNEQYDDFTMPSGHVAKTTSEFVNTWKTSSSCGDVPDLGPHTHTHTEQCTKLFTTESPFRKCFTFLNPSVFRDACDHVVNEAQGPEKQKAACTVAASYVASARFEEGCQLALPNECGECIIGSNHVQVGDSVQVKTPAKSADVIFVIEQVQENEEVFSSLIVPLVSTLTNDFKEKGITDVKFALIGFGGPNQKWVHHYTTDGQVEFNGKTKNIAFEKKPEATGNVNYATKLKAIADQINVEIGNTQMVQAVKEASQYPFRPEAVKSIVAVLANPCQKSIFPISLQQLRMVLNRVHHISAGINVNVVTQIKDLSLEGKDAKATANIVGFDDEAVYTQSEAKRKVLRGDEDAFKSLKYSPDICIDYAQSVGGAVFNSDNFVSGKPGFRKNFLNVLSTKVVEDLTSEELHKECTCEFRMGLAPVTRCKVVGRKEKEQIRHVKGGVKG